LELEFPPALRGGTWLADILAGRFHWICLMENCGAKTARWQK
jgi:hypothetical protein